MFVVERIQLHLTDFDLNLKCCCEKNDLEHRPVCIVQFSYEKLNSKSETRAVCHVLHIQCPISFVCLFFKARLQMIGISTVMDSNRQ